MQNNDFVDEEHTEQNQQLIHDIKDLYDTRVANQASLARIRMQLLDTTKTLPYNETTINHNNISISTKRSKEHPIPMHIIQPLDSKKRAWQPHLNAIAAAVLITILVTSAVALFIFKGHQITGSKNPNQPIKVTVHATSIPQIKLRSTWTEVTTIQGQGTQTLTNLQIPLTRLWGFTIACENGHANLDLSTVNLRSISGGCLTQLQNNTLPRETPVIGPQSSNFASVADTIKEIKVTAPQGVTWQLQFAKPSAELPILTTPGSDWSIIDPLGETGTGGFTGGFDIVRPPIMPEVWGVEYLCIGSGPFSIDMNPDVLHIATTCDNTIHMQKVTDQPGARLASQAYVKLSSMPDINIETGTDNDWQALIVECTNAKTMCQ